MSDIAYGFGGRLSEPFPSQILMDVTEICNLECTHCPHVAFKASAHYGARHLDKRMFRIREDNPWVKVADAFVQQVPVIGALAESGYVSHAARAVSSGWSGIGPATPACARDRGLRPRRAA